MTGKADIQYGMATYIDPETSIRIAFRSSYRGDVNYDVRMPDGVVRSIVTTQSPTRNPAIAGKYGEDVSDLDDVWVRYCAKERSDFLAWMKAKGFAASSSVIELTDAEAAFIDGLVSA